MGWKRILVYGICYWLLGGALAMVQLFGEIPRALAHIIFYSFAVLAPVLFAYIFFARMAGIPTGMMGMRLAVSWMILFSVLDVLVFWWWLDFPIQIIVSWQLALAYAVLLVIGVVVASLVSRARRSHGPEGLV